MSRTSNFARNAITSIIGYVITLILQFITRAVFVKSLGTQYLGITGLFANIVSMLSLTELGMGTAIMYKLYKPISENDEQKLIVIMKFYKNIYRIIGLVVLVIGFVLMPFLKFFIKDNIDFVNIYFVFFMYLMQSVLSYMFFSYKSSLIQANQKEYVITLITNIFIVLSNVLQIICLMKLKSFNAYMLITTLSTISTNLVISFACDKMYPFIKKKTKESLSFVEKKQIFKDCYALFIYKVNGIVLNSTDNLILSKCIGLSIVGIYSNYLIIFNALNTISTKLFSAVTASLGNLHVKSDTKHELKVFNIMNLGEFIIASIFAIGTTLVSNELIEIWLGSEFLLDGISVMLIGFKLYIEIQKKVLCMYRNTMGLFQQAKYRPVAGALINLVASIILVKYYGINGVLAGTILADLLTYMWYDPYIIFKHSFKNASVKFYYLRRVIYFVVYILMLLLTYQLNGMIRIDGIVGLMIHGSICVIIPCFICIILHTGRDELLYIIDILKNIYKRRIKGGY